MPARALPLDIDLVVHTGACVYRQFRWLPDGTTPQDFTDWTATLLIGKPGGRAIVQMSTSDHEEHVHGLTELGPLTHGGEGGICEHAGIELESDGILSIHLNDSLTQALSRDSGLIYVVDLVRADDHMVIRFLRGRIRVLKDPRRQA